VFRRKRFLIGGFIILLAVVFLGYMAFMSGVTYYYEVDELLDQGNSVIGQTVRVSGKVAPGIEQEDGGLTMRFTIADNTGIDASLPIVYQGVSPDAFTVGKQVVVEGQYTDDGIFEAQAILTKCSSKYVPEE
jgi:cytochrome c-type biogenesis protein CcmE